jgi:rubrerythrin
MLARVVAALRGTSPGFHECRRCGTTVDPDAAGCPACDSTDIARYDI